MEKKPCNSEDPDVRKGPWTVEEDLILISYISIHGEGGWNMLAKSAGLNRTGKSCRLRWLNYLRPDVRRGNITAEEEHVIMELHDKWGNKWSKIAKHLPGRTDNEIKNYWRTRLHKQIRKTENTGAQIHNQNRDFSYEMNDQTNQLLLSCCGPSDHAIDQSSSYFPSVTNLADQVVGQSSSYYVENPCFRNDQSSFNEWSMEDLWSTDNLLNGD